MKTLFCLAVAVTLCATAGAQMDMEPYKGSPEFEQLKALVGVWEGEMPMKKHKSAEGEGEGEAAGEQPEMMKMVLEYRLTAGGSVIQETINAGSPMEMVTMYHDGADGLGLTHYCAMRNQPRLDYTGTSDGQLHFALSADNSLDADTDMFMTSLALTIVDANNVVQRWTMNMPGQEMPAHDTHFTRVQ